MPHFDALKIYSCGKQCETSNFSFTHNVFYPIWHFFFHSKCALKCRLQFVSFRTSRKFCRLVMGYRNKNITADSCPQPSQLRADSADTYNNTGEIILENCTTVQYYDYFSGSEASFALSFLLLAVLIPGQYGFLRTKSITKTQMNKCMAEI